MRKSTVFISVALTTFALVVMYGVVSAYRGMAPANSPVQTEAAPTSTEAPAATPEVAAPEIVTPEQAAQTAAKVLGRTDLLSAESANLNGVDAYKISFQSGDTVYVGLNGQILSIQTVPQVVMVPAQPPARQSSNNNTGGNNGGVHEENEHEGGD
jgi:hypothetical protein